MKIAVAGTGYVGLVDCQRCLSQHHKVMAVDIIPEKVELINQRKSPIQDEYIEKYLVRKGFESDSHFGRERSLYGCRLCESLQHLPTMTVRRTFLILPLWKM